MFTTFGPGHSHETCCLRTIGSEFQWEVAVSFVAGFNGTLDSISVAVSDFLGVNNSYILSLASDSSGGPGATLETFSGLGFPSPPGGILTVNSTTNSAFAVGSTYWVVMAATDPTLSDGGWFFNNQGTLGFSARNTTSPQWSPFSGEGNPSPAVEVNATADVPEPATLGLTFAGLAALVTLRRLLSH